MQVHAALQAIRVLVCESHFAQREALLRALEGQAGVIVRAAPDLEAAAETLQRGEIDVVVGEWPFPGAEKAGAQPPLRWIALAPPTHPEMRERALALGAAEVLEQPVEAGALTASIRRAQGGAAPLDDGQGSLEAAVTGALLRLRLPPHLQGYRFARVAILLALQEPQLLARLTQALYPAVAQRCGTTPWCVERGIRNAVSAAWLRGGRAALARRLGCRVEDCDKPTNSEFLAAMVDYFRLELHAHWR